MTIDLLGDYARKIRAARTRTHPIVAFGHYAEVTLRAGATGPSRTFYYTPGDFYIWGLRDANNTDYFVSDSPHHAAGTRVYFDCTHQSLGTAKMSVNRATIATQLDQRRNGSDDNLKQVFVIGVVFFSEAVRSDPVLTALTRALTSRSERHELELSTLEHYFTNWRVASQSKAGKNKWNTPAHRHRWVGLDASHYPKS